MSTARYILRALMAFPQTWATQSPQNYSAVMSRTLVDCLACREHLNVVCHSYGSQHEKYRNPKILQPTKKNVIVRDRAKIVVATPIQVMLELRFQSRNMIDE